jgi:hypothetical protein
MPPDQMTVAVSRVRTFSIRVGASSRNARVRRFLELAAFGVILRRTRTRAVQICERAVSDGDDQDDQDDQRKSAPVSAIRPKPLSMCVSTLTARHQGPRS